MAAFVNKLRDVILLLFVIVSFCNATPNSQYGHGVLMAKNGSAQESVCVAYYPKLMFFPPENEVFLPLFLFDPSWYACNQLLTEDLAAELTAAIKGHIVLVSQKGNCTIIEKAENVERYGGKGIIIVVSDKLMDLPTTGTYPAVIPIAFIRQDNVNILKGLGSQVEAVISSPIAKQSFNYSWIAIVIFAVLAVGIGSYRSGLGQYHFMLMNAKVAKGTPEKVSPSSVIQMLFVTVRNLLTCGTIALFVYLYISYTVPFTIAVFVIASTLAFYSCFEQILDRISIGTLKFRNALVRVDKLVLFIASLALVICWTIYRKDSFAWILQNVLSLTLSINVIRSVRLCSLKACTVGLALLFTFEAIFVLMILSNEVFAVIVESVAEAAASENSSAGISSSGTSVEFPSVAQTLTEMIIQEIPMLFRFPHLGYDPLSICRSQQQYTFIGLESIFIPGMLIGFCHYFDQVRGHGAKIYFTTTLVVYGLGLLSSIACSFLMDNPQLIHLYLVPSILITIFIIGLCRRELKFLWKGGEILTRLPIIEKKQPSFLAPPNLSSLKWSLPPPPKIIK